MEESDEYGIALLFFNGRLIEWPCVILPSKDIEFMLLGMVKCPECQNDILENPRIIIRPNAAGGLLTCLFCKDYILVTLKP